MSEYSALSGCYDELTRDIDYAAWADYLERQFKRRGSGVKTVLDLACGTGTLSWILAERGYEVIGVDASPEMLAEAAGKGEETSFSGIPPLFLCQPMERLDLYGTVDACVCMLDGVNHVTRPRDLRKAFSRVQLFLEPDGLFVFDALTPAHFEALDGGLFLDETEDAYCVWRTQYHRRRRICGYAMDIFTREGERWLRREEYTEEYAYTPQELTAYLLEAGFVRTRQHGHLQLRVPKDNAPRIFFAAWKNGAAKGQ